ncbi:hypothetical protein M6D93_06380 [Jatrophihabitans telluris]|uniref:Uncharacterized protein n=1 Tax=Jatrophihabitans telluris TaxID=2038343 RepID=A0ABY4R392_9ACTN|nr:hypothetical protein [Jatrophihabitans telluris]UQX89626.1 hypothetical protein M6D93_06380 [Jatrophihabitans telluris]
MSILLVVILFAVVAAGLGFWGTDSRDTSFGLWAGTPHPRPPTDRGDRRR